MPTISSATRPWWPSGTPPSWRIARTSVETSAKIERTVALRWPIVCDSRAEAERVRRAMMEHQGLDPSLLAELAGTPEDLFELTAAYAEIGYRHIIAGLLAPYDEETMTRIITEIRPRLEVMLTA